MTPTRKIITGIIFAAAIAGCFVALRKEGQTYVAENTTPVSTDIAVKGAQETATQTETYTTDKMASHMDLTSANIIWFTNYYRVQNHVKTLSPQSKLKASAASKVADMFAYQYFDHTRPGSTRTFDYFIDTAHYDFIKIGENLAMGNFTSAKAVVDAWIKSPEHKKNIMDPAYTEIGVAIQSGTMNGARTEIFVQHFGEPSSNCAHIESSAQSAITLLKGELSDIQARIASKEGDISKSSQTDSAYNTLVDQYNALVGTYNSAASHMSDLVKLYNKQVSAYDACVRGE